MHTEVIIAGFGGQGVMLAGKLLAQAGMNEGYQVVWIPSYGPEMRGGTANCTVVVSEGMIGSPVLDSPQNVIAMNLPSFHKFEPRVKARGWLLVNSSLVPDTTGRDDIREFRISATELAHEEGSKLAANMVVLGAFVALTGVVKRESVRELIESQFASRAKILEINLRAFDRGYALAAEVGGDV
jgi:2-oxoglutarate ferredoxin oxidoreductase subunit gamma